MPFGIPSLAFAAFYDSPVAFHGTRAGARSVDVTVDCCAFEGGFDDPLLDQDADTDVRVVGLSFPISGWPDQTPPQVGERVTFENTPYRVKKVERVVGDYHVTIREASE